MSLSNRYKRKGKPTSKMSAKYWSHKVKWQTGGYTMLKNYSAQHGINYDDLLADFISSPKDEQQAFLMQIGGSNPIEQVVAALQQVSSEEEQMQVIQQFAQQLQVSPEELIQEIQNYSQQGNQEGGQEAVLMQVKQALSQAKTEEEQMQMLQQFAQELKIAPEELIQALQQHEQEELKGVVIDDTPMDMQRGGIPTINDGYYATTPEETPILRVGSGNITMKNLDFPIEAYDGDTGEYLDLMQPGEDYQFDVDSVIEKDVIAQDGTLNNLSSLKQELEKLKSQKAKFKNYKEKNIYDKTLNRKEELLNEYQNILKEIESTEFEDEKLNLIKKAEQIENQFNNTTVDNYTNEIIVVGANTINTDKWISSNKNVFKKATKSDKASGIPSQLTVSGNNNKKYTLNLYDKNKKIYVDQEDNKWGINSDGNAFVIEKANVPSSVKTPSFTPSSSSRTTSSQRTTSSPSIFTPRQGGEEWTQKWEQFLVGQGLIDGDKNYSVDQIDDFVSQYISQNKDKYKNNPYISKGDSFIQKNLTDGKYGNVHASFLPPTEESRMSLESLNPMTAKSVGNIATSLNLDSIIPSGNKEVMPVSNDNKSNDGTAKSVGKRMSFDTQDMFGNLLRGVNVARAFRPIDLPYLSSAEMLPSITPKIDPTQGLSQIMEQSQNSLANVNTSSPSGMAYAAVMQGKQQAAAADYMNKIATYNQEVDFKNREQQINAINVNAKNQDIYNSTYLNELYSSIANRDLGIDTVLNQVAQDHKEQQLKNEQLNLIQMAYPQFKEVTDVDEYGNPLTPFKKLLKSISGTREFADVKRDHVAPIITTFKPEAIKVPGVNSKGYKIKK